MPRREGWISSLRVSLRWKKRKVQPSIDAGAAIEYPNCSEGRRDLQGGGGKGGGRATPRARVGREKFNLQPLALLGLRTVRTSGTHPTQTKNFHLLEAKPSTVVLYGCCSELEPFQEGKS